jgi:hypothetical protein
MANKTIHQRVNELADQGFEPNFNLRPAPIPPEGINYIAPPIAYGLANAGDLVSTELALRNPKVQEANPVMRGGLGERLALKLGTTAALTAADYGLQKAGHKNWAKAIRIGVPLILGGIAASNYANSRR